MSRDSGRREENEKVWNGCLQEWESQCAGEGVSRVGTRSHISDS